MSRLKKFLPEIRGFCQDLGPFWGLYLVLGVHGYEIGYTQTPVRRPVLTRFVNRFVKICQPHAANLTPNWRSLNDFLAFSDFRIARSIHDVENNT